jgi:hypothetical protein
LFLRSWSGGLLKYVSGGADRCKLSRDKEKSLKKFRRKKE